jgi:hypothetical protein
VQEVVLVLLPVALVQVPAAVLPAVEVLDHYNQARQLFFPFQFVVRLSDLLFDAYYKILTYHLQFLLQTLPAYHTNHHDHLQQVQDAVLVDVPVTLILCIYFIQILKWFFHQLVV